jgi:hypothetical protein
MYKLWFEASHDKWRNNCLVPDDVELKTKNSLVLDLIIILWDARLFLAKYLGIDSSFGLSYDFLSKVPQGL